MYWKATIRSPHSLLFCRPNSPNSLSLSSQQRGSSPLTFFVASSGPAPTGPCLSCAEGSRAGHRTPRGVLPEWSRGAESPPWPTAHAAGDAAQNTVGLQGCERTLLGHVELFIHQYPQLLLGMAALNPSSPSLYLYWGLPRGR